MKKKDEIKLKKFVNVQPAILNRSFLNNIIDDQTD